MRRIRTAVIIIALLACAVITGILLLQPRTLKTTAGTPLTQAGAYEGPGGGTLYVTPSHRLVGAVTLPETPYRASSPTESTDLFALKRSSPNASVYSWGLR